MDKIISWIIIVIGLLLLLGAGGWLASITAYNEWLIAIGVLAIGILRLKK